MALTDSPNACLAYAIRRDLLDQDPGPARALWALPEAQRLLRRQLPDGSWPYPGGGVASHRAVEDYAQIETNRTLGILVEKFAATRRLEALEGAAEFLFSRQSSAGDFRGIYGRQYTPNYTAGILELLVKAGYARDPRLGRAFAWLLHIRQADGGWAIPMLTRRGRWDQPSLSRLALAPDRARPSSHIVTGVVLRAFAAHPRWRRSSAARHAADLLADRLLERDAYPGRAAPSFWVGFGFPFWFTDLLSALDSLTRVGVARAIPRSPSPFSGSPIVSWPTEPGGCTPHAGRIPTRRCGSPWPSAVSFGAAPCWNADPPRVPLSGRRSSTSSLPAGPELPCGDDAPQQTGPRRK